MREATKTNRIRDKDFSSRYLSGRVIDIGCADDPVCAWAEPFDVAHGDANNILQYLRPLSYDTVYSSHCLEHMLDTEKTLRDWWMLIKPGGYLVLVVPHEDLYEQGFWPSLFNHDHKATFRLRGNESWSPVSRDIHKLVQELPNAKLVLAKIQDHGYDYQIMSRGGVDKPVLRKVHFQLARAIARIGPISKWVGPRLNAAMFRCGCPVDQTLGTAVAQIEIIARKLPENHASSR